jgi:hypothetical protein
MRVYSILALACGISSPACSLYFEGDPGPDGGPPAPACELHTTNAAIPGYPFDFAYYQRVVWPLTQRDCASSGGCHGGTDSLTRGFEVWPQDDQPCSAVWSFNAFYDYSDYVIGPENSFVLAALDGRLPTHPIQPGRGFEGYDVLSGYIERAWSRYQGGPGRGVYFDLEVFQGEIQPMLDDSACTASGCHDVFTTPTFFGLHYRPAQDSTEMYVNFDSVARYVNFQVLPEATALFTQATNGHGGVTVTDPAALLDWIADAYGSFEVAGD